MDTIDDDDAISIVIGSGSSAKTFHHSRFCLRKTSGYFDQLLLLPSLPNPVKQETPLERTSSSSSSSSRTVVALFPHKTPAQWEVIAPFFEVGIPTPVISHTNVRTFLEWNDELAMKNPIMKEHCDDLCSRFLRELMNYLSISIENIDILMETTCLSIDFDLRNTRELIAMTMRRHFGSNVSATILCSLRYAIHKEQDLWNFIVKYQFVRHPRKRTRTTTGDSTDMSIDFEGVLRKLKEQFRSTRGVPAVLPRTQEDGKAKDTVPPNTEIDDDCVVIEVGSEDTTFSYRHSLFCLRRTSDFFDKMFAHAFTETHERRVQFPHKTAAEWELMAPFFELGVPTPNLTHATARPLLEWNNELAMKNPIIKNSCDSMFEKWCDSTTTKLYTLGPSRQRDCEDGLEVTCLSIDYDLKCTKAVLAKALLNIFGCKLTPLILMQLRYMVHEEKDLWDFLIENDLVSRNQSSPDDPDFERACQISGKQFMAR